MGKLMESLFDALDISPTGRAMINDLTITVNDQRELIDSQSDRIDRLMDEKQDLLENKRELLDRITYLNQEVANAVDMDEIVNSNRGKFVALIAPHIKDIDVTRKIDRIRKAREMLPGLGLKAAKDLIESIDEPPSPCGGW